MYSVVWLHGTTRKLSNPLICGYVSMMPSRPVYRRIALLIEEWMVNGSSRIFYSGTTVDHHFPWGGLNSSAGFKGCLTYSLCGWFPYVNLNKNLGGKLWYLAVNLLHESNNFKFPFLKRWNHSVWSCKTNLQLDFHSSTNQ